MTKDTRNPAPFAGAVGDAQNNHSTEAETVPVLDEEFDESDAEVIPEMGKSKTKEKSKEVSMEEAGVLNTLQKPQTANTTAPDAFKNDPVLRFAKSNLPGFYERVRKGEGTACRMQELLIFMKQIAENEGVLYESLDGFPMEHTVGYAISDDCWINQNKHSVEKMLGDVLRNPDVTLQASGRTNFRFRDTQQKPERDRELTFPPIPDDVDTVLFPYCRKIEFEYAQKELGLLTRVLGRVQANVKFEPRTARTYEYA
ncbi:hypothetical protein UCDDS831_g03358 [Diplodia seriata]|uniref:Uncharacterized protein n=1 Tax=Diplodia seriata TaxID=420778 RepID=A0A0G2EKQ8_9PEZI|nr:hypothetical protein UCDDS831_g03358 [Diplodia seriata]